MADTFVKIATVTVGAGGASTIDITSIPSTYTDLQVVLSGRGNNSSYSNMYVGIKFNSSGSNLSSKVLYGSGVGAGSFSDTTIYAPVDASGSTTSTFGSYQAYIPNYAGSTYKSVSIESVAEKNASQIDMYMTAGLWSNTAAITSITLYDVFAYNNFDQYSTATLYGIKNS